MIIRKIPVYNFESLNLSKPENGEFLKDNFYLSLKNLPEKITKDTTLFEIPGSLEIKMINRSYNDKTDDIESIKDEKCFYYNDENENILEAVCHMQTADGYAHDTYIVRMPMSAPHDLYKEIGIYFDGAWIRFMKNGEILNENSGMECFLESTGEIASSVDYTCANVNKAAVTYREETIDMSPSFYFPHGFNTLVGDVMVFAHNGTYHIMYLLDRRHHGSRNKSGAHYIAHMTSTNLKDWYEQAPIVEIKEAWQSCGTGTMLYHNGKYYMAYGFHTERYRGKAPHTTPPYNEATQEFSPISFDEIFKQGGIPKGATYSVSEDGINFTESNILFHEGRNPSAYTEKDGSILLYCSTDGKGSASNAENFIREAGNVWRTESFDKPFKREDNNNFFTGKDTAMKNTIECPSFFEWNGYKYLISGFTGYYRTFEKNQETLSDASVAGENIYDGLGVPMVMKTDDNRYIIAGWFKYNAWASALVQRELIQEDGGKLGMKWIPEMMPATTGENLISEDDKEIILPYKKSTLIEMEINPADASKLGIHFGDENNSCELQLDIKKKRAQFNNSDFVGFAPEISTAYEQISKANKEVNYYTELGLKDIPQNSNNYSIPDVQGIDKPFTLKLLCRYSKRLHDTVIDVEIAGRRTMISVRYGLLPTKMKFISDGNMNVKNISVKLITDEE